MKDLKIPFTFYDFFGYFLPGLMTILITLLLLAKSYTIQELKPYLDYLSNMGVLLSVLFILLCYTVGHFMASVSSLILEKLILECLLFKMPEQTLFKSKRKNCFSGNFSAKFRFAVEQYFNIEIDKTKDTEIFWLCNSVIVNECPNIYSRVFVFLSFYGFARTMSLIFSFSSIFFIIRAIINRPDIIALYIGMFSVVLCVVFFYQYLRFLRYHRTEVFYGFYAHIKDTHSVTNQGSTV